MARYSTSFVPAGGADGGEMSTTDGMSMTGYADFVRRVVAWLARCQANGHTQTYAMIARRYKLTLDEVEDVVGDSEVYGPKIMPHANMGARGNTTVEVLG